MKNTNMAKEHEFYQTSDITDQSNVKWEEFKNLDEIEEFLVKIFPKLKSQSSNSTYEEDNISVEESKKRLIIIWIFITTILCLIPFGQLFQILRSLKNPDIVETVRLENINEFGNSTSYVDDYFK